MSDRPLESTCAPRRLRSLALVFVSGVVGVAVALLYHRALLPDFESATRRLQGDEVELLLMAVFVEVMAAFYGTGYATYELLSLAARRIRPDGLIGTEAWSWSLFFMGLGGAVSATAAIGLRIGIRYEGRHFWLSVCVGASMFVYAVARWRWAAARLRKRMAPSADRGTAVGGGSRPMK